ncbi:MAG: hypothetical protein ABIO39_11095 [Caulobacteraceae bacterium]
MKRIAGGLAAAMLLMASAGAQAAAPRACDRACLKGMLDGYVSALVTHDPSKIPAATDVKFTENGYPLFLGDGFWRTAGPGTYRLYAIDTAQGQAALHATLSEGGEPIPFLVRLKVLGGKITEIETIVARNALAGGLFAPEKLPPPDLYNQPLPKGEHPTRAELVRTGDAYFTAVQTDGTPGYKPAPFAADANRFENGVQTTNVSIRGGKPVSISAQLDQGMFKGVNITDRRYPVVDTETGVVLGIVMFRRAEQRLPANSISGPARFHGMVSEMFKISGGKIRQVRAVMLPRPFGSATGW